MGLACSAAVRLFMRVHVTLASSTQTALNEPLQELVDSGQLEAEFWQQPLCGGVVLPSLLEWLGDLPKQWLDAQLHEWDPPCPLAAFPLVEATGRVTKCGKPCSSVGVPSHLDSLPPELLQCVALHLPSVQDVTALWGCCKGVRAALRDESGERFWAALFARHFAGLLRGVPEASVEWRGTCLACMEAVCGKGWRPHEGLRVWRLAQLVVATVLDGHSLL